MRCSKHPIYKRIVGELSEILVFLVDYLLNRVSVAHYWVFSTNPMLFGTHIITWLWPISNSSKCPVNALRMWLAIVVKLTGTTRLGDYSTLCIYLIDGDFRYHHNVIDFCDFFFLFFFMECSCFLPKGNQFNGRHYLLLWPPAFHLIWLFGNKKMVVWYILTFTRCGHKGRILDQQTVNDLWVGLYRFGLSLLNCFIWPLILFLIEIPLQWISELFLHF